MITHHNDHDDVKYIARHTASINDCNLFYLESQLKAPATTQLLMD